MPIENTEIHNIKLIIRESYGKEYSIIATVKENKLISLTEEEVTSSLSWITRNSITNILQLSLRHPKEFEEFLTEIKKYWKP